ncbi:MAG: DNA-binding response regulator [Comamonadaceae bacterium PBBC2]|nr:MAG: DNA-binding response regulator [Comamonadaceae bacterium PBBC2]
MPTHSPLQAAQSPRLIRVLIAEDEDLIRDEMARLLALHWPDAQLVGSAEDGAHALELWEEHQPDVAFLDIQMPGMTGLQVASLMTAQPAANTQIVFVTAYDQYALAAFEAGAVDYLLKPVRPERLLQVIAKLKARWHAVQGAASNPNASSPQAAVPPDLALVIQNLARQLHTPPAREPITWLSASLGQNIKLIAVKDIVYFQSDNKYTRIVTAEGEALVRKSLRELLDELDGAVFKQVHRGSVVNMLCVSGVSRDENGKGTVKFKGITDTVDVSSAYMGIFRPT